MSCYLKNGRLKIDKFLNFVNSKYSSKIYLHKKPIFITQQLH
jgi:hypothetical protein